MELEVGKDKKHSDETTKLMGHYLRTLISKYCPFQERNIS